MAIQLPIDVSRTAEEAWWILTGGNPTSFPKKREIELAVNELGQYWGKAGMFEKYKLENQWDSGEGYLLPIFGLTLGAYAQDDYSKVASFPAGIRPMDLPKGRGLAKVTYRSGGKELPIGKLTLIRRLQQEETLGRKLAADYYYSWEGSTIVVVSSCPKEAVGISSINIYPIIINSTNMEDGLKGLVISKVTERFRGYAPKDFISDQNPTVLR